MATKNEVIVEELKGYLKASKKEKGVILDRLETTLKMHRKALVRRFKNLQTREDGWNWRDQRGRPEYYTPDVSVALKEIWEIGSEVCGELLQPMIPEYVEILRKEKMWKYGDLVTGKLLAMSAMTVKRRTGGFLKTRSLRGISSTKPSHLKEIIPIFTGPWKSKGVGYGQLDTVVHCGSSLLGDMAYTVNWTDVATLWGKRRAQWNKGQYATKESLNKIKNKLPFPMLGAHPDTGSEFINWYLKDWCDEENIELTRSRPNHKNDNAYVEQKNGHIVRRFLGYTRIDQKEVIPIMNEFYDVLDLYLNHFVASRKCLSKIRIGSKYKKMYDKAQTPYTRVLNRLEVSENIKIQLKEEHEKLNPLILKRKIDTLIKQIFETQKRCGNQKTRE